MNPTMKRGVQQNISKCDGDIGWKERERREPVKKGED